jgi:hypothetical protein
MHYTEKFSQQSQLWRAGGYFFFMSIFGKTFPRPAAAAGSLAKELAAKPTED